MPARGRCRCGGRASTGGRRLQGRLARHRARPRTGHRLHRRPHRSARRRRTDRRAGRGRRHRHAHRAPRCGTAPRRRAGPGRGRPPTLVRLHHTGPSGAGSRPPRHRRRHQPEDHRRRVSAQAFALRHKLLEVDAWVRCTDTRVVEVHPEVSFATLAGTPLTERKITWTGAVHRRRLLAEACIRLDDDLGPAGSAAAIDDVLDAAIAAWTARRVARSEAHPMPDPPEVFSDGISCAIWT